MTTATSDPTVPASGAVLFELIEVFTSAHALLAAGELGFADALADGPLGVDELAGRIGADGPALGRLLRSLAPRRLVTEVEPDRFALTPLGETLRGEPPGALHSGLRFFSEVVVPALAQLAETVRTGEPAADRLFGEPLFTYLEHHRELDAAFGRTMKTVAAVTGPITGAHDFSAVDTLVDVGGGQGTRTVEVLTAHPHVRGVILDRPGVAEPARAVLAAAGLADRCEFVGGSFFEKVPDGGDCYLLSAVLGNWDDERAGAILRTVRRAMAPHARLVIFEPVRPEGDEPHLTRAMDLLMLVLLGGRIRSAAELSTLLDGAGLRLERVVAGNPPFSVVEAVPV